MQKLAIALGAIALFTAPALAGSGTGDNAFVVAEEGVSVHVGDGDREHDGDHHRHIVTVHHRHHDEDRDRHHIVFVHRHHDEETAPPTRALPL